MVRVLVTGANSLLATHIIIKLLEKGYSVRGLLRTPSNFRYAGHANFELVQGDITDFLAVEKAVAGCHFIIHVAAVTAQNLLHYSDYEQVNVTATETLIQIAIQKGVKRLVYVSSANAFGHGTIKKPGDESAECRYPFTKSLYALSKRMGQQMAFSYQDKVDVVVVNPTFMLGAYDSKPSSGKIIMMGYHKKVIFCPPGGKNFVGASDVAEGTVCAMETGKNGEAYLLCNENLSYREFFEKLSSVTHQKPFYFMIPKSILYIMGLTGSLLRKLGVKTDLSFTNMKILCLSNFYSNQKAVACFGLEFHYVESSIDESVAWFKKEGVL